jgi:hypothetical protein
VKTYTIKEANSFSMEDVLSMIDWQKAKVQQAQTEKHITRRERDKMERPSTPTEPLYAFRWEQQLGDVFILVRVPIDQCQPGEQEWNRALRLKTTQQYIKWFQKGHRPPPITIVEHRSGKLVSLNRRRWLAAREAGIETLLAWYSPTNKKTGVAKWRRKLCFMRKEELDCTRYLNGSSCVGCSHYPE